MYTTHHKYISQYPISSTATKLILGTIHPHFTETFAIDFFYGNKGTLWNIIHNAFPAELTDPLDKQSILQFLHNRNIAISDTILSCERKSDSALDQDLHPLELNHALIEQVRNSNITEILCTSGFAKNNAFRLFYQDILKKKITSEIIQDRQVRLSPDIFSREVLVKILYSPAGTSNTGLAKSKSFLLKKHLYENSATPVKAFKIDYFKEAFS